MGHEKVLRFSGYENRQRFALIMHVLSFVHEKLVANSEITDNNNFYCTKRSFYYELKNKIVGKFIKSQITVDHAIDEVSTMLECGPWEIGK